MLGELNAEQLKAATSKSHKILCLAGAGGGKTKTLIARIAYLVQQGVDPSSILSLTFTNAAAFEMKERYKKLPNIDFSKGCPEFRTFHSFCYSLIIKNPAIRSKLGYSKIPEVCDDIKFKEIKERIKLQLGIKLTDAELESNIPLLNRARQDQKELFKKGLVKALREENVITFDIMCYNVCELFERGSPEVAGYKTKYKYLLVNLSAPLYRKI